jgi:hypothetical protein
MKGRIFEKCLKMIPVIFLETIWANLNKTAVRSKMFLNRRGGRRLACNRLAIIRYDTVSFDCMITEVSSVGVKLIAEDRHLPAEFTVKFSTGPARRCRLQWRSGFEFGAEYLEEYRTLGEVVAPPPLAQRPPWR